MKDIDVNSPEFKEKITKMNSDFLTKLFEKDKKIKEMSTSSEYILWLKEFTDKTPEFSDEDYVYFPEQISESDNNYVDDLGLFFEVIERYAEKNYITKMPCDFGGFYPVRLDNNGFYIGCLVGQGVVHFCKRVEVTNKEHFIDYNDIMNNKTQPYVEEINRSLDDLKNKINDLYRSGVPLETIRKTANQLVEELEKELNEKAKLFNLRLK